jgi:hypothetical protein
MLKKIVVGIALVLVVLMTVIALQPSDFRVARSAVIAAPPAAAFAQVNDFRRWEAWNPWGKIDPAMRHSYEGPPSGVGAVYRWAGNHEVGEGRMTIVESRPTDLIRIQLEFFKPYAGTSEAEFSFKPEPGGTAVTWSMSGQNNFMAKAMHLVMNIDTMIGEQFDKGLADLKAVTEATAKE